MKSDLQGLALVNRIAIITHRRPSAETNDALLRVLDLCREMSVEAVLPEREVEKYPAAGEKGVTLVPSLDREKVDMGVALGGDGTILRAFSRFPEMNTPILGVNFGRVGFLAAIAPGEIAERLRQIFEGGHELVPLALLELHGSNGAKLAVNDVVVHKPDGGSVINLSYSVGDVNIDSFSCDGLVLATPAGSTAYNMSVGGPLLSLGLEAFVLSAIAPHTLHARAQVLAPGEEVRIRNESKGAVAAIYLDGRSEDTLPPGESVAIGLSAAKASLVQLPGTSFHRRLRDKFIQPSGQD
jgi:NAD+ kinase